MKKLYKKKGGENLAPEEDVQRNRLFGKSKSKSPNPSSNPYAQSSAPTGNPYAQSPPPGGNPYAAPRENASRDPYAQSSNSYQSSAAYSSSTLDYKSTSSRQSAGTDHDGAYGGMKDPYAASSYAASTKSGYPPSYNTADLYTRDKSAASADSYGGGGYGGSSARYNNPGSYGNQGGYGGDRWGSIGGNGSGGYGDRQSSSSRGPEGYGGLGRTKSNDSDATEAGKAALFGDAPKRLAQSQSPQQGGYGLPPEEDPARGGGSGVEGSDSQGYGTYRDRQLTAEEEEEEEVQGTKNQIREIKRQDVSSTRNALRIAEEAEQSGRETLERLGAQGERIHNTEKNLDLASNQNRLAKEKAAQLQHLNRSMFAMSVSNPFTKSARERDRDEQIMSIHQTEREKREAIRAAAYASVARREEHSRQIGAPAAAKIPKRNLAERSKYQFEADSEDEAMEDEIDGNLDLLSGAAGRLNRLGHAMGSEIEEHNKHLERIAGQADRVDDQIHMNRSRLDRIR